MVLNSYSRRKTSCLFFLMTWMLMDFWDVCIAQQQRPYPRTKIDAVAETIHGVGVTDPYRWLEDSAHLETRAWIEQQTLYTKAVMDLMPAPTPIRQRLEQLMKRDSISIPIVKNGRYFFTKLAAESGRATIFMRNGLKGRDELLIPPLSVNTENTVGIEGVSQDGNLLAYGTYKKGEAGIAIRIFDVATRRNRIDILPRGRYHLASAFMQDAARAFLFDTGVLFKPDNSGFYYARVEQVGPAVYLHTMGTEPARDKTIFKKVIGLTIPGNGELFASLSQDGRYLVLFVRYYYKDEVYVEDTQNDGPMTVIVDDIDESFLGRVVGDHIFLWTTLRAPNGQIVDVDLKNPARERWRTVIPESQDVISGFSTVGGKLAVNYLRNTISSIRLFDLTGNLIREIVLPKPGTLTILKGQWDSEEAFFGYTSFTEPMKIFRYQLATGNQEPWDNVKPSGSVPAMEVYQVWFDSKGKTKVPMFLLSRPGLKPDRDQPTLIIANGGFNFSLTPKYSALACYWVEQGGVFVVVNARGGAEFGQYWHWAGLGLNRQNQFEDLIAASEWLLNHNYTKPSLLAISGSQNGGLAVGALITQRPQLFQAAICAYPVMDMVRFRKYQYDPIMVFEYGRPDIPNHFNSLYAYSPYHHVKDGTRYPAVLLIASDARTDFNPAHARKMTARLQAASSSGPPVILQYYSDKAFSFGPPVEQSIDEITLELRFLMGQLGISPKNPN